MRGRRSGAEFIRPSISTQGNGRFRGGAHVLRGNPSTLGNPLIQIAHSIRIHSPMPDHVRRDAIDCPSRVRGASRGPPL